MQHQDLTGSLGPESGSRTSSVIRGTQQPLLTRPQLCCAVSCAGRNIPPQQEGVGWGERGLAGLQMWVRSTTSAGLSTP